MLCQSKNVYPYENVQNTIINDSKVLYKDKLYLILVNIVIISL